MPTVLVLIGNLLVASEVRGAGARGAGPGRAAPAHETSIAGGMAADELRNNSLVLTPWLSYLAKI